ncbi:MAG: MmcQ/YjbR family DNA-binding protein [Ruminococcaceae bacterium]|nr:MmcQ/YjbR family DNA-binding protein [Oscillospiraceae bacterium]
MQSFQEVQEYGLSLPGAYLDYPFDDKIPVLRHRGNGKIFAFFIQRAGVSMVNLKCEPMVADFWRDVYADVLPGYHMNKTHWNSILLPGCVPEADLVTMINDSHRLTAPKRKAPPKPAQPE